MFTGFATRTSCQTLLQICGLFRGGNIIILASEMETVEESGVIYIFSFLPNPLLIEHLKLSCGIHSFSLNLNFDFLEIITL